MTLRYRRETGAEQSIVDQRLLTSCFVVCRNSQFDKIMLSSELNPESEAYGGICLL